MKLYIPDIGDKIALSKDWNFNLYEEYRNESLLKEKEIPFSHKYGESEKKHNVSLNKGTVLIVDRIYIRKGKNMGDFSSVSFRIENKKKIRFWVKLKDVNNIEFDETQTVPSLRTQELSLPGPSDYRINNYIYSYNEISEEIHNKILGMIGKKIKMLPNTQNVIFEDMMFNYNPNIWMNGKWVDITILKCKNNTTPKTLRVECHTEIESVEEKSDTSFLGIKTYKYYKIKRKIFYKLFDGDKELGEWKTPESMLKAAKKYLIK